mgnify:FL=1
MSKYLAFLDIDGVFATQRQQIAHASTASMMAHLDPVAVAFMNRLHDTHDIAFVVISTWKNHLGEDTSVKGQDTTYFHLFKSAFECAGFRGNFHKVWRTNPKDDTLRYTSLRRANEIKDFLADYAPDTEDFLIFDDNDYQFASVLGKKRLIKTHEDDGLLTKHMKQALSITGSWDKK